MNSPRLDPMRTLLTILASRSDWGSWGGGKGEGGAWCHHVVCSDIVDHPWWNMKLDQHLVLTGSFFVFVC